MAHIIMCDGKCRGVIVSGKVVSIQEYDEDGLVNERHYCKTDFLSLPISKLLPSTKGRMSFSISCWGLEEKNKKEKHDASN